MSICRSHQWNLYLRWWFSVNEKSLNNHFSSLCTCVVGPSSSQMCVKLNLSDCRTSDRRNIIIMSRLVYKRTWLRSWRQYTMKIQSFFSVIGRLLSSSFRADTLMLHISWERSITGSETLENDIIITLRQLLIAIMMFSTSVAAMTRMILSDDCSKRW